MPVDLACPQIYQRAAQDDGIAKCHTFSQCKENMFALGQTSFLRFGSLITGFLNKKHWRPTRTSLETEEAVPDLRSLSPETPLWSHLWIFRCQNLRAIHHFQEQTWCSPVSFSVFLVRHSSWSETVFVQAQVAKPCILKVTNPVSQKQRHQKIKFFCGCCEVERIELLRTTHFPSRDCQQTVTKLQQNRMASVMWSHWQCAF